MNKTIKCNIKSILKKNVNYSKIYDCINRTNELTQIVYFFIKAYMLHKYENHEPLQNVNNNFIRTVFIVVAKPSHGAKSKNECYNDLIKFLDKFKKDINYTPIDACSLSFIKNYEIIQIETSFKNNLTKNFTKYIEQYVNESFNIPTYQKVSMDTYQKFTIDEKKKYNESKNKFFEDLKQFKKEHRLVKNDLLKGTLESDEKYHDWIKDIRKNIFPNCDKNSIIDDVKINPLKYLNASIIMNRHLEDNGKKLFQAIPMRTDMNKKYVTFDTSAINDIFGEIKYDNELKKICSIGKKVWQKYFNLNGFKIKGYVFNDMFSTNGVSMSLSFIKSDDYVLKQEKHKRMTLSSTKTKNMTEQEREEHEKEKRLKQIECNKICQKRRDAFKKLSKEEKEKICKCRDNYTYIEDLIKDKTKLEHLKQQLNENKIVVCDPGKRSPLNMCNGIERFEYSRGRRLYETKRLKYNTLRQHKFDKTIKSEYTDMLTKYNCKTTYYGNFIEYIKAKINITKKIDKNTLSEYSNYCNKLNWFYYINKKCHEDKLMNEIENKYGKDCTIVMGDWSRTEHIKGISVPNNSMKTLLSNRFELLEIDEYNTSKIYYEDAKHYQECKNLTIRKTREAKKGKKSKKKNKYKKKHKKDIKKDITTTERKPIVLPKETHEILLKMSHNNTKIREDVGIKIKLHSVLTYQMGNNRKGCINRDRNATKNMMIIVKSLLLSNERPIAFQRSNKNEKVTNLKSNGHKRKCI